MMLLLAIACAPSEGLDSTATEDEAIDLRLDESDLLVPDADAEIWWGPELEIQPGEDVVYCHFGTYTGPDRGVHALTSWQNRFGHHLVLMGTTASELDYPDGTLIDCTETGSLNMADIEPMILPTASYVDGVRQDQDMAVPEGMAMKLDEGQRYVVQAHYINTGTEPALTKDALVLEYVDPSTVETWTAPLAMNHGNFRIPPGEEATVSFDCSFGQEFNVLYTLGHMHEWGKSIKLEQIQGETVTTVFDIAEWDPAFRDAPPTVRYDIGEYVLPADATFRTTCTWFNDTDAPIEFPHEMCVSVGMVYPQTTPLICDAD